MELKVYISRLHSYDDVSTSSSYVNGNEELMTRQGEISKLLRLESESENLQFVLPTVFCKQLPDIIAMAVLMGGD